MLDAGSTHARAASSCPKLATTSMLARPLGADLADWGGAIVWRVAMWYPEVIEKLVVMAGPHPNLFMTNMDADQKRRCATA